MNKIFLEPKKFHQQIKYHFLALLSIDLIFTLEWSVLKN